MHIHIVVGKSVNVKAVSWLVNMHTATSPLYNCEKGIDPWGIKFNTLLGVVGGLVYSFGVA